MIPVLGSFSTGMLSDLPSTVTFTDLPAVAVAHMKLDIRLDEFQAHMFSRYMAKWGMTPVEDNRSPIKLGRGDVMVMAQYVGPECKGRNQWDELPDGKFWFRMTLVEVTKQ